MKLPALPKQKLQQAHQLLIKIQSNSIPTYAVTKSPEDTLDQVPQPQETVTATSGVPSEQRKVLIWKPAKSVMQSGQSPEQWHITFDQNPANTKWINPLIGWTASDDALASYKIKFHSVQEAVAFAQKNNWEFEVQEPEYSLMKPKQYADNYRYSASRLRQAKTK